MKEGCQIIIENKKQKRLEGSEQIISNELADKIIEEMKKDLLSKSDTETEIYKKRVLCFG